MFFEVILIGEREIELHSAEIKCGKVFKCWSELVDENEGDGVGGGGLVKVRGHLYLLIGTFAEFRSLPSLRDWDMGVLSFLMILHFKRMASRSLREDLCV